MTSVPKLFVIVLKNEKLICINVDSKPLVQIKDRIEEAKRYTKFIDFTLRGEQKAYVDPNEIIAIYQWPFEV